MTRHARRPSPASRAGRATSPASPAGTGLKDFYHERTNFQFIKHSRRWLILSGTLHPDQRRRVVFRGLNLSIEFEGGTAWQVTMADGKNASTQEVRDLLDPLGFSDAKVSTLSGSGGESVRVQAEIIEDPIRTIQQTLADTSDRRSPTSLFVRNDDGSGTFTFQTAADKTVTQAAGRQGDGRRRPHGREGHGRRPERHGRVRRSSRPARSTTSRRALADYAGVNVSEVSVSTVGPTWGETVSRKALQALIIFFIILALYLTFRFEWKMSATAIVGGDPRHHRQRRRVRALPIGLSAPRPSPRS